MRRVLTSKACRKRIANLRLFIGYEGHGVMKHGVIVCGAVGHDASQWRQGFLGKANGVVYLLFPICTLSQSQGPWQWRDHAGLAHMDGPPSKPQGPGLAARQDCLVRLVMLIKIARAGCDAVVKQRSAKHKVCACFALPLMTTRTARRASEPSAQSIACSMVKPL